jgi:hypothetical protein
MRGLPAKMASRRFPVTETGHGSRRVARGCIMPGRAVGTISALAAGAARCLNCPERDIFGVRLCQFRLLWKVLGDYGNISK